MPWSIASAPRGSRPDFTLRRQPPNAYTTPAQQWFIEQLLLLEPGTQDGGGYTPKRGYHATREQNDRWDAADGRTGSNRDYSVRDTADRRGPNDKTAGRDWTHPDAHGGDYRSMARYGDRLEAAYNARDPRLAGWREALGQTDLDATAEGLDFRYWYRRTPDSSHAWHWHFSEDRAQVQSFGNKWAMLSLLAGWTIPEWQRSMEEDVATPMEVWTHDLLNGEGVDEAYRVMMRMDANVKALQAQMSALSSAVTTDAETDAKLKKVADELKAELQRIAALDLARDQGLAAQVAGVDEEVVAKLADASLPPGRVAELLRAALGERADDVFRAGLGQ